MAFTPETLSRLGTSSTNAPGVWSYQTADPLVFLEAPGYFDSNSPAFRAMDLIIVQSSDGMGFYSVVSSEAVGVVVSSTLPNGSAVRNICNLDDFAYDDDTVFLQPDTVYLLTCIVDIGNRVFSDPGGPIELFGYNANISGITSTDTTRALFTLTSGASFDSLSITTGNTFVSAAGTFGGPNLTFDRLNIDCPDPGDIGDYTAVLIDRVRLRNQTQPLDFFGQYLRVTLNVLTAVGVGPGATIARFTNTVNVSERIFITGCYFDVASGQTAIEFDPGITIGSERIVNTNNSYEGDGTYLNGIALDDTRLFSISNTNLTDTRAVGGWIMQNNTTPTIVGAANTPTKIAGSTDPVAVMIRFTDNGNNRLDYEGDKSRVLITQGNVTIETASNNQVVAIYQAVNGVVGSQPIAKGSTVGASGARVTGLPISAATPINDGDFFELYIENQTSSESPTVTDGFLILAEV